MYTQCPECSVVLSISSTDLRAAGGEVCCGACNHVFNALHHLIDTEEDSSGTVLVDAQSGDETLEDDPPSTDENDRTDEISETAIDGGFETGTEENLQEIDQESVTWARTVAGLGLADQATLEKLADLDEHTTTPTPVPKESPASDLEADTPSAEQPASTVIFELVGEVDDNKPADVLYDPDELLDFEQTRSPWVGRGFGLAIVLAGLGLIAQVVHFQRNELALNPAWGPYLQSVYERLGISLEPNWDVTQYQVVRGSGSSDPRLPGVLLVRARLSNLSALGMPYPLIKLSLEDRWGDVVANRTFAPKEYLESSLDEHPLLAPGSSVPVQIRVIDPGNATGYSLDACLSNAQGRQRCAYDSL